MGTFRWMDMDPTPDTFQLFIYEERITVHTVKIHVRSLKDIVILVYFFERSIILVYGTTNVLHDNPRQCRYILNLDFQSVCDI
jgi:hypothetical protein